MKSCSIGQDLDPCLGIALEIATNDLDGAMEEGPLRVEQRVDVAGRQRVPSIGRSSRGVFDRQDARRGLLIEPLTRVV